VIITCHIHGDFLQKPAKHFGGSGCQRCHNKTEGKLLLWLNSKNYEPETQIKFDDCQNTTTGRKYKFDFKIGNHTIVELDGAQHFHKILNWEDLKETRRKDIEKQAYLRKNNYILIRIYQPDVWGNKNNWDTKLEKILEENINKKPDHGKVYYIGGDYESLN